jgi:hypothetical protein
VFQFTFDYISTSHISAKVNGSAVTVSSVDTSANPQTVTLASTPAATDSVEIIRTTPDQTTGSSNLFSSVVDFQNGSVLKAQDLDDAMKAVLFIAQEAADFGKMGLPEDATDADLNWTAQSKRIKNVGDPTNSNDAINKAYFDEKLVNGTTLATTAPQAWSITSDKWVQETDPTTDIYVLLGDTSNGLGPLPLSDNNKMFFVEVGGVLQHPDTDYTVVQSGEYYKLTLVGQTTSNMTAIGSATRVRNMGIARSVFSNIIEDDVNIDSGTLFVDTTNNRVGVGTTSPDFELEVEESAGSPIIQVSDGTRKLQMGSDINNPFIGTSTAHDLRIISNNTEQMRIKSDGKVGIGTNAPQNPLHLNASDSSSNYIQLTNSTTGTTSGDGALVGLSSAELLVIANQESNDITLQTSGADRIRVKADGKVGVATTAPDEKFHVKNGNVRIESAAPSVRFRDTTQSDKNMQITCDGLRQDGSDASSTVEGTLQIRTNNDNFDSGSTKAAFSQYGLHLLNGSALALGSADITSATALDYYAEGHIVPTFSTGDGTSITLNAGGDKIRYVRIGRLVTLTGRLLVSSGYATGSENNQTAKITNLPFTCLSGTTCTTAVPLIGTFDAGGPSISGAIKITQNTKELSIGLMETNNLNLSKGSTFLRTGDELFINISYMANPTE